jgi:hypothetical protein
MRGAGDSCDRIAKRFGGLDPMLLGFEEAG